MIVAIVPAAGLSHRMGRPKPLLDLGDGPLIARVVAAIREGGVSRVVVVAPPADRAESAAIASAAESAGAEVVVPAVQPSDMRASIEAGLARFEGFPSPRSILIAPTDIPGITGGLVNRLIEESRRHPRAIVVPIADGKRGHPAILPWSVALAIRGLPAGVGVKSLFDGAGSVLVEMPVDDRASFLDLDTPDDYRVWTGRDLS